MIEQKINEFNNRHKNKPIPYKKKLEQIGLNLNAVANSIGVNSYYFRSILNGNHRLSHPVEQKLKKLLENLNDGKN